MPILDIKQLTVTMRQTNQQTHALIKDINCNIKSGEILAIIGPNGAGKSTLLKAIAGDYNQHHTTINGNITIKNQATTANLRARQVAVLPQFSLLNFPYQVHEVVALGRIPHSSGKEVDADIIDQTLNAMDIGFLKHRLYTELSGGEKQRVQLARVLAQLWRAEDAPQQTRLLLLDEPTSALDLGHQQQLMQTLKQFSQQGVAIMMVLHDINLAARYADKLLALLCSQTVAYGTVPEVITVETISRLFDMQVDIIQHPDRQTPIVVGL